MEDKIIKTTEEMGHMTVNFKNGEVQKVLAKTVYTHWESGRKDCAIHILGPVDTSAKEQQV